ncbi:hypothetical protein H2203_007521 [Taxawa tesnikishii (nom. ined.)]|nr:hypothetical protein H2203_007521 [Dothideales sp. JES 119]
MAAPGVLSMLKTSTDTGDIEALAFNKNRLPVAPRPAHKRRSNVRRLSGSSHHTNNSYAISQVSGRGSSYQVWESASANPRGSLTSLQTMPLYSPDTMSPTMISVPPNAPSGVSQYGPAGLTPAYHKEGRSYSMTTQAQPPHRLGSYRSMTSLRSQEGGLRVPHQRPQYAYPTRLKQSGYRPTSPALSDFTGAPRRGPSLRHMQRPPLRAYHSDYMDRPLPPQTHLGLALPTRYRAASNSLALPYEPNHFSCRPGPMRSTPAFPMPRGPFSPGYPPPQRAYTPQADSTPSTSEYNSSSPLASSIPPTPGGGNTIQVAIGPAFIDPALDDMPNSLSEQNMALPEYLAYSEAMEKAICCVTSAHTSRRYHGTYTGGPIELPGSFPESMSDLAEMPATPISAEIVMASDPIDEVAELAATPVKRITREMILATVAPSSSEAPSTDNTISDSTVSSGIVARVELPPHLQDVEGADMQDRSDTSVPSSPQSVREPPDSTEPTATFTMTGCSNITGMDYAIRFEVTDHTSEQPQLGDTQASNTDEADMRVKQQETAAVDDHIIDEPVSPLHPGEQTNRDSIVSPLPALALRTDNQLEEPPVPGSFPGDAAASPAQRSRSMSYPTARSMDTSSRYSLPNDLSEVTEGTGSVDAVTDIAVKFTIPQQTNAGKVQLVTVTPTVESPTPPPKAIVREFIYELPEQITPRASVVTEVVPLKVVKKEEKANMLSATDGADLSSFIRRSFPRRQSVLFDEQPDIKRCSRQSTIDLRFSNRYRSPQRLPGVKEDSQEDMRTSNPDIRGSGISFTLPHTLATRVGQERFKESRDFSKPDRPGSQVQRRGMTLSEMRNLPSLNFSRMDLIDKLNQALEVRPTGSFDMIRSRDFSGMYHPSPQHSRSMEALRERYTSFFKKPDEFEVPISEPENEDEDDEKKATEDAASSEERPSKGDEPAKDEEVDEEIKRPRAASVKSKRPLSAEELLTVATEVNRLSIPSVSGLTERLSELLPSIKHLHLDSKIGDDEAVEHTIEEIHHLGERPEVPHRAERPETMFSARSSVGLRMMAAAADKIVTNGTHDSTILDKDSRLMKELPPLPENADSISAVGSIEARNSTTSNRPVSPISEPEAPAPVLLRKMSIKYINDGDLLKVPQSIKPTAGLKHKRSLVISSPSSRPWNLEESYPWSGTKMDIGIDINFPPPVHHRDSMASERPPGARKLSSDTTQEKEDTITTLTKRLQSPSLLSQSTTTRDVTKDSFTGHERTTTKRSLFGSITRKIRLGSSSPRNNRNRMTENSAYPISPDLLSLEDPVDPGDRYPTSALRSPGTAVNHLEDVRSFFSDDSSDRTGDANAKRTSFRKHLTQLASKRRPSHTAHSIDIDGTRSLDHRAHRGEVSTMDSRVGAPSSAATFDGAVGLGKMEFRVKRVAERLRHLWERGGELFRSLSGRGRATKRVDGERERDEWLEDSLCSGGAV